MKELIKRLSYWLNGHSAPPYMIDIRPTDYCNLKCMSCMIPEKKPAKELSKQKYLDIIEESFQLGVKRVEIVGGGEPMFRGADTLSIMNKIKESYMIGTLTTNGTLFNKEAIKTLVNIEWDLIAFSLDGPDAETNDFLRGVKGSFSKCLNAIKEFNYWKQKLRKNLPEIILIPVLSNLNYNKIDKMIKLAYSLHIKKVEFKSLVVNPYNNPRIRKLRINRKQSKELYKLILKTTKLANLYGIETNLDLFIQDNFAEKSSDIMAVIKSYKNKNSNYTYEIPCFLPFYYMAIGTDGAVEPCVVELSKKTEKITDKKLKDIWYGHYFNKIRKRILNGKLLSRCRNCCGGKIFDNQKIKAELTKFNQKNEE